MTTAPMPDLLMPDLGDVAADPNAPAPGVPNGWALLVGLIVGGAYWWMGQRQNNALHEEEEEEEQDEEDAEEEDEDEPAPKRTARLSDVTTDSLLDEPALIAERGKPGDCFKAVKMIAGRRGLAETARERQIFHRVLTKVAADCRGSEDEVDDALEEISEQREEIEDVFGPTSQSDTTPRAGSRSTLHEPGFRKSKKSLIRKTSAEGGDARSKGRASAGRPRGASFVLRKPGSPAVRMKKEKAATKRGFKWRKEDL